MRCYNDKLNFWVGRWMSHLHKSASFIYFICIIFIRSAISRKKFTYQDGQLHKSNYFVYFLFVHMYQISSHKVKMNELGRRCNLVRHLHKPSYFRYIMGVPICLLCRDKEKPNAFGGKCIWVTQLHKSTSFAFYPYRPFTACPVAG